MAIDMLKDSLKIANFISIGVDTSNRGNLKMLPVVVRYFSSTEGVQNKMIDFFKMEQETGEEVSDKVKLVIETFDLRSKFIALGADNCVSNFGGVDRGGQLNVFTRLKNEFQDRELVGCGCCAHLIHKAIEKACHTFQSFYDIEAVVVKIFGYFKHITVRNTRLQRLFSEDGSDEIKLLGYANTRFLGFKDCISRIIDCFDVLKTFFEGEKDAPLSILKFLDHQFAKIFLIFVRDQCQLFENAVKSVEGDSTSAFEAAKSIKNLLNQIEIRKEENFSSIQFQQELDKVLPMLPFTDVINVKKGKKVENETVLVNEPYLRARFDHFYGKLDNLNCYLLIRMETKLIFNFFFYFRLCLDLHQGMDSASFLGYIDI